MLIQNLTISIIEIITVAVAASGSLLKLMFKLFYFIILEKYLLIKSNNLSLNGYYLSTRLSYYKIWQAIIIIIMIMISGNLYWCHMSLNVKFELVPDTPDIVPRHQCRVGRLISDKLALIIVAPVLLPVNTGGATISKRLHPATAEISNNLDIEIGSKLFVVFSSVSGLLSFTSLTTLNPTIDDVGCQPKSQPQSSDFICATWGPVTLNYSKH